jgi:signal transduction histidine kinase
MSLFGFGRKTIPQATDGSEISQLRESLGYYTTLQKTFLEIVEQLDFEKITQKIVDHIVNDFGYGAGVFFYLDKPKNFLYSHTVSNTFVINSVVQAYGKGLREHGVDVDTGVNHYVLRTFKERMVFEGDSLPEFVSPTLDRNLAQFTQTALGIKKVITLPVMTDNEVLGVIMFASKRPSFTEIEKKALEIFTKQISLSIKNSVLYTKTQTQVVELEVKNQDLSSLFNLTSNISQSLNPETVAQTAVNSIPQDGYLLGGILTQYNKETEELLVSAVTENDLSNSVKGLIGDFSQYKIELKDPAYANNLSLQTFKTGEVHYTDKLEELLSPPVPKAFIGPIEKILDAHSAVSFPLRYRDEINGTISYIIKGRTYNELQENEKQLLNTYTLQIGFALENANLFRNLETTLSQLREARRRERDMLDVMGHELRTPISIARNSMLMIQRMQKKNNGVVDLEFLNKYLDMSVESIRREVALIETLLSATKVDASRLQLQLTKVDFKDVVNDGIEGQHVLIEQKGLKLNYTPPANDLFVYADRVRTQEIMDNFLSNAAKYTEKGDITISIWQEKDLSWISIKDSGMGISPEDLQNLGKKFFRAKQYIQNQAKTSEFIRPGGTGLGLYVAFDLIRVMGGKLYINSEVGKGSVFTFGLPTYQDQPNQNIDETFVGDPSITGTEYIFLNGVAPLPPK